jgi:hypothetical protein
VEQATSQAGSAADGMLTIVEKSRPTTSETPDSHIKGDQAFSRCVREYICGSL